MYNRGDSYVIPRKRINSLLIICFIKNNHAYLPESDDF